MTMSVPCVLGFRSISGLKTHSWKADSNPTVDGIHGRTDALTIETLRLPLCMGCIVRGEQAAYTDRSFPSVDKDRIYTRRIERTR